MNLVEIYFIIALGTAIGGTIRMWGRIKDKPGATAQFNKLVSMIGKPIAYTALALSVVFNSAVWPITIVMWTRTYFIEKKAKV